MLKKFLFSSLGHIYLTGIVLSILLLAYLIHNKYDELYRNTQLELVSTHQILKSSASDVLGQQEVMLKVLGRRLLDLGGFENPQAAHETMDFLLKDNPAFVAYGLATPEGELKIVSKNLQGKALPNLKQSSKSASTFNKALQSDNLVIGSTYYFAALEKWITPLRFALRNDSGEVMMVITTAFDIDNDYNPWRGTVLKPGLQLSVTTEPDSANDYYPVYYYPYQVMADTRQNFYGKPLPGEFVNRIQSNIRKVTDKTLKDLIDSGDYIVTINDKPGMVKDLPSAMTVLSFDQHYRYYLAIRQPVDRLNQSMVIFTFSYFTGFIIINILSYILLFRIYTSDSNYRSVLRKQAITDQLTTLPNRYDLASNFRHWADENNNIYAMLYVDLDNFKFVNDQFGHSVGDQVLIEVAQRIAAKAKDTAWVIRQGGDEFILLYNTNDRQELAIFAEKLLYAINEVMYINNIKIALTASIGIALNSTEHGSLDLDECLSKADLAMYAAKKRHNHSEFYTDSMQSHMDEIGLIEHELRSVNFSEELFMVYQPQVSIDEKVIGFEALLRWNSKSLGFVPPDKFIPVSEASGLINSIGDYVIDSVLKDFIELIKLCPNCTMSINVSVHQLVYGALRESLKEKTQQYGIDPNKIIIEVTESLFIEDFKQVETLLKLLRSDGFYISLDDFGTGYSSLSMLRKLPINEVKVDKSFIRDILDDDNDRKLIKSIIDIGHGLQIPVLAEGVEYKEQAQILKEFGCSRLQGYLYKKPATLDEIIAYLKAH